MQIQNQTPQTSFKSLWRIIDRKSFNVYVFRIRSFEVLYPWTSKESIIGKDVFTRGVFDCKTHGVTNGEKAFMGHIDPNAPENFDFNKVDNNFLEMIKPLRNQYLQGYILGGKINNRWSPRSMENVQHTIDIYERENIPYSRFVGGNYDNDLAYFSETDTFLIGNERAESLRKNFPDAPMKAAKIIFDDVKLCNLDEISW